RAVQELARQGWVTATSRRGAAVRRDLPAGETGARDAEAAIRRLAVRWRLVGGGRRGVSGRVGREAAAASGELKAANVVLTPYFHLAEARELAPDGAQVVPLNFVASEDAMRSLVELPADTLVGVLA